jgi:hypothetical protein
MPAAQTRLDEQFRFDVDEPQQRTMRRLVATLENRLAAIEATRADYEAVTRRLETVALARINDLLLPSAERLMALSSLGFLVAYSDTENTLATEQQKQWFLTEGPQRDLFTPTPFVTIQRRTTHEDYAIGLVLNYERNSGSLLVMIVDRHGGAGPFDDWVISAAPGVSEATRSYFDRAGAAAQHAEQLAGEIANDRVLIADLSHQLTTAGLNPDLFAWRDGSRAFTAVQSGVAPGSSANDATIPTSAWARSRINEGIAALSGSVPTSMNTLAKIAQAIDANNQSITNIINNVPVSFVIPGQPEEGQNYTVPMAVGLRLPANLTGSMAWVKDPPATSVQFEVKRITAAGVSTTIGLVGIAANGTTAVSGAGGNCTAGSRLQLVAPDDDQAMGDMADIGITLLMSRS